MEAVSFSPIGFVRGGGRYPQEAPRQSVFARNRGLVELLPGREFETALADLAGFERIWLIFLFDRAGTWKPMVRPPDGAGRKIGLFATRSPHRPNPIGISAVELEKVEGLRLFIRNFDLLDGTPVLDIKPYIPAADAFPESAAGWRDAVPQTLFALELSPKSAVAVAWIRDQGGPDLEEVAHVQLATRQPDPKRQRLRTIDSERGEWELAFRTWRIRFMRENGRILVISVGSGYSSEELADGTPDPYRDKPLHRSFCERFLR